MKTKFIKHFILIFFIFILGLVLRSNNVYAKEGAQIGPVLYEYNLIDDKIENLVCSNCENISGEITIPAEINGKEVTSLGKNAFYGATNIEKITIPNSVTYIGNFAFAECKNIKEIEIPDFVTNIGNGAFQNCESITSLVIPSKVTAIGEGICTGCVNITNISVDQANVTYSSEDNVIFSKDKTCLVYYLPSKTGDLYTVPNYVKTIKTGAFEGTRNLINLIIQDGTEKIEKESLAFRADGKLHKIIFPDSVTEIADKVFIAEPRSIWFYCNKGSYAQQYANNKSIICKYIMSSIKVEKAPSRVIYCAGENFDKTGMIVKKVYNDGSEDIIGEDSVTVIDGNNLTVGKGNVTFSYSEVGITVTTTQDITVLDTKWEFNVDTNKKIINNLKCKSTDKISGDFTIPSELYGMTVQSLGEYAFFDCSNLTRVTIPSTITKIGKNAFKDCKNLSKVVILGSLVNFDDDENDEYDDVFYDDKGITIYGEVGAGVKEYAKSKNIEFKYILSLIEIRPKDEVYEPITYYSGEDFNKDQIIVNALYYNDDDNAMKEKEIDKTDYTVVDGTSLTAGQEYVTIVYEDKDTGIIKTATCDYIKVEKILESIKVATTPTNTEYFNGDNFDKTGMVVKAVYSDGSEAKITNYTIEDGENLAIGKDSINITYTEKYRENKENEIIVTKTVAQPITVLKKLNKIEITTEPANTKYLDGEYFDEAGMIIKAIYSDESEEVITDYTIKDGENLSLGKEDVTISYTENNVTQTVTQAINVIKKLKEIKITSEPTKTEYLDGEDFDTTGMEVKAVYSDGSEEKITDYTIKIGEAEEGKNLTTRTNNVIISYTEKYRENTENETTITQTAEQPITVLKKLKGIKITTEPIKLRYIEGENFDKTGMVVKAVYSDESEEEITNYNVDDGENLTIGTNKVTISYTKNKETKTVDQKIEVIKKQLLSGLKVETSPLKTKYEVGDNFDQTGMIVKAVYEDKSEIAISKYTVKNGDNLTVGKRDVILSYVEGPVIVTTKQEIIVVKTVDGIEWTYNFDEKENVTDLVCISNEKITGEFKIPEVIDGKKVISIGKESFNACNNVNKLIIPESITTIKDNAFANCKNLEEIVIPKNVIEIGKEVFKYSPKVVIYCYEGSKAESYAKENGIQYKLIEDESKILTDIVIVKPATKTEYEEGETFDTTGLEVKAVYKDKHEQIINNFKVENGEKLKTGQESVTISYLENKTTKTATQAIKVNKKQIVLSKITIVIPATKTTYIEGENFDKTGMEVKAVYSDGSDKEITDYVIAGGENLTTDKTKVTLMYTENGVTKDVIQEIIVNKKPRELSSIKIIKQPTKVVYIEGEDFDGDGIEVIAVYDDNSQQTITDYTVSGGKNLTTDIVGIKISYTEGKITETTMQAIAVNKKDNSDDFFDSDTLKVITKNNKKYLVNIPPKCIIATDFSKVVKTGYAMTIKDVTGSILIDKEKYMGTGMKILITKDEETTEYIAVVLGDCTGDGLTNAVDLLETVRQYKKRGSKLLEEQMLAIKSTYTTEFSAVDLLQELRIYKKYLK